MYNIYVDINKLHVGLDLCIFVYKHEVANTAYPGLPRVYSSILIIIVVVVIIIIITLKIIVVFIFLALQVYTR